MAAEPHADAASEGDGETVGRARETLSARRDHDGRNCNRVADGFAPSVGDAPHAAPPTRKGAIREGPLGTSRRRAVVKIVARPPFPAELSVGTGTRTPP